MHFIQVCTAGLTIWFTLLNLLGCWCRRCIENREQDQEHKTQLARIKANERTTDDANVNSDNTDDNGRKRTSRGGSSGSQGRQKRKKINFHKGTIEESSEVEGPTDRSMAPLKGVNRDSVAPRD